MRIGGKRVQYESVIEADRRPGILALMLGTMLEKAREIVGLSYDEAAERLGREADWLIRVETGFATATPEDVARILIEYGVREARASDRVIDLARRAASPPQWLGPHTSRLSATDRDMYLIEAESTLAQVHGCRLVPYLAQTEDYFKETSPGVFTGGDVGRDWELLAHRQAHRPAGVTRLLDVIIDESALQLKMKRPGVMAGQIQHLIDLADSDHGTVRVVPFDAPFWENRGCNFDMLSFAGADDRIGICYSILGAHFTSDDLFGLWSRIGDIAASDTDSRAMLVRYLEQAQKA